MHGVVSSTDHYSCVQFVLTRACAWSSIARASLKSCALASCTTHSNGSCSVKLCCNMLRASLSYCKFVYSNAKRIQCVHSREAQSLHGARTPVVQLEVELQVEAAVLTCLFNLHFTASSSMSTCISSLATPASIGSCT
jgi:hypothetical protein